jgi:L-ascorbate metabolism protein UlaG (beta-lactamase superfamily)
LRIARRRPWTCHHITLMELTWHGRARFRLRASGLTWWFDTGMDPSIYEADPATIVLDARATGHMGRTGPGAMPVLDGPGEYELRGVPVVAVRTSAPGAPREGRQVAYRIGVDGLHVGYLGPDTGHGGLAGVSRILGEIAPVEVAIVPVGEGFGLGASDALSFARSLEAKVTVAYAPEGDAPAAEAVRRLCREMGSEVDVTVRSVNYTGTSVPAVPRVVVLSSRAGAEAA